MQEHTPALINHMLYTIGLNMTAEAGTVIYSHMAAAQSHNREKGKALNGGDVLHICIFA